MQTVQYPCISCGAQLEFSAEKQKFACKYCDSEFSSEQIAEIYPENEYHPLDIEEPKQTDEEADEQNIFAEYNSLYNCPSCGAAVVTDANTAATKCFYCHSPVVLTGRLSGEYKPSKMIPFVVTEQAAKGLFSSFCHKRWFVPSDFKKGALLSDMTAIYIPYWIATCSTGGRITAKCNKVRTWRSGDYQYTETREYHVVRAGNMIVDKIPADASSKADDTLMESIEPYDYNKLEPFKMSYLTGYQAEKFDVTKEQVYPNIKMRAVNTAVSNLRSTIVGYSSVSILQNTVDVNQVVWDYYLLPVWFLSYQYKDKKYFYAINGQTGKFNGNLPVVWGKVALFCGILSILAAALIFLGGWLV